MDDVKQAIAADLVNKSIYDDNQWRDFTMYHEKDPFKVGDIVKIPKGYKAVIEECHGKNFHGEYEYYVNPLLDDIAGNYYIDTDLVLWEEASPATPPPVPKKEEGCKHERAYKNFISASLEFWVCPDCKQEVSPEIGLAREVDRDVMDEFERLLK